MTVSCCNFKSATMPTCTGKKADGNPCSQKVKNDGDFCRFHKPKDFEMDGVDSDSDSIDSVDSVTTDLMKTLKTPTKVASKAKKGSGSGGKMAAKPALSGVTAGTLDGLTEVYVASDTADAMTIKAQQSLLRKTFWLFYDHVKNSPELKLRVESVCPVIKDGKRVVPFEYKKMAAKEMFKELGPEERGKYMAVARGVVKDEMIAVLSALDNMRL